jgi:hypothetical protein
LWAGVAAILAAPGFAGGAGIDLIYNNVIFNVGVQAPIQVDNQYKTGHTAAELGARIYNNFMMFGSPCVRIAGRVGAGKVGLVDLRNNHCIGPDIACYSGANCEGAINLTMTNNLVQTSAQAAGSGYSASNFFFPTSASAPTVDAGVSLASIFTTDQKGTVRPSGNAWDIGPYEYGGSAPSVSGVCGSALNSCNSGTFQDVPDSATENLWKCLGIGSGTTASCSLSKPPLGMNERFALTVAKKGHSAQLILFFCAGSTTGTRATTGSGSGTTGTRVATTGKGTTTASEIFTSLYFEAEAGTILPPFETENNYIVQKISTENPSNAGKASYRFTVPQTGEYIIQAKVNAPSGSSNSLFVGLDSDPSVDSVWHVQVTAGFELRSISIGGNFTGEGNPAHIFTLTASQTHTLIINGREPGCSLDYIQIILADDNNISGGQSSYFLSSWFVKTALLVAVVFIYNEV